MAKAKVKQLPKRYYRTAEGREPARDFIGSLDPVAKARVFLQIDRLKKGNAGKGHGVGGVSELVIDYGPGYRVYYVVVNGRALILLLTAGSKKSQKKDIKKAKEYFADYESKESKKDVSDGKKKNK